MNGRKPNNTITFV